MCITSALAYLTCRFFCLTSATVVRSAISFFIKLSLLCQTPACLSYTYIHMWNINIWKSTVKINTTGSQITLIHSIIFMLIRCHKNLTFVYINWPIVKSVSLYAILFKSQNLLMTFSEDLLCRLLISHSYLATDTILQLSTKYF